MADVDDCMREMFMQVAWMGRTLAVPLMQLTPQDVDEESEEAVADWHYWVARGYQLL